jgi:synaptojanin
MASSVTPRKLPPPYDPAALPAKAGRMTISDDRETPPPPPPPRRQTGMSPAGMVMGAGLNRTHTQPLPPPLRPTSATSNASSQLSQQMKNGKPAPPVAKKPAHLATAISPNRTSGSRNGTYHDDDDDEDDNFRPPLPVRAATGLHDSPHQLPGMNFNRKPVAPPKPAIQVPAAKSQGPSFGGVGLPGMTGANPRPMPPTRRGVPQQSRDQSNVDLLDSLDEGQVGGWESLKPSTKA